MPATQRAVSAIAFASLALFLSSCGSSSSSTAKSAQAPIFTSTAPTAAAQGSAYSYTVAATDPAGGTVTYALTTSPTGAAIGSDNITWTPTAAQSRTGNSFTVTATTSEGGSATQSWTVSPTGTVTVTTTSTNWTASGPVTFPGGYPVVDAFLQNSDGSISILTGSLISDGVYNISNVPAGYYWLVLGNNTTQEFNAFWTNTSNFDAGQNLVGSPTPITSTPETTTFILSLSGLNTATPPGYVVFATDNTIPAPVALQPPAGAGTLNIVFATTYGPDSTVDWSQIGNAFLLQYDAASVGSLNFLTLGPELTLSGLAFTDGATNNLTETLQPSPQVFLNLAVEGSQWADLFNNAAPSVATPESSWLSVSAQPYVTGGVYTSQDYQGPDLFLAMPTPVPELGSTPVPPLFANCAPGFSMLSNEPAILTDQSPGTLQYDDPFPSSWTRSLSFCESGAAIIPVGTPPINVNFMFSSGVTSAPSSNPIVPLVSQVQSPTINGGSLFTAATVNTTALTLSWLAPASGSPYGYSVTSWLVTSLPPSGAQFSSAGTFSTSQTSVALPPLTAGSTYIFEITTMVDGSANIQTSPYRSTLPTGYATVVSAPITISSGATTPEIRGDASVLKRLTQPKPSAPGQAQTVRTITK
jgi:hypothetical protein